MGPSSPPATTSGSFQSLRQSYQTTSPATLDPDHTTTVVVDTAVQTLRQSYKASTPAVPWVNRAEEIMKSEVGPQEYDRRLERQNLLFEVANKIFQ